MAIITHILSFISGAAFMLFVGYLYNKKQWKKLNDGSRVN